MPPSRRRPTPTPQPSPRRPKVAGLRRPAAPADQREEEGESPALVPAEVEPQVEDTVEDTADQTPVDEPVEAVDEEPAGPDGPVAPVDDEAEDEQAEPVKPRPAGKRRATGTRRPARADEVSDEPRRRRRSPVAAVSAAKGRLNLAIVLAVVALVCAGLTLWFRGEVDSLTESTDTDNTALADSAATSELMSKLRQPFEASFSIDYKDLDKAQKSAEGLFVDKGLTCYNATFTELRKQAPEQKLLITLKIRDMAVRSLRGDDADLVVFADQISTRTAVDKPETLAAGAAIGVTAHRVDGQWKVAQLTLFGPQKKDPSCQ